MELTQFELQKAQIAHDLDKTIRTIPDFPKPGIQFKDIMPILANPVLCKQIVEFMAAYYDGKQVDVVVGIESRGFLFGMQLANKLNVPFVPIRKLGKLPAKTVTQSYALEYGEATIEIHEDAFQPGAKVIVHDDLLATGGTVVAASELVKKLGGEVASFAFLINLDFLAGKERLKPYCSDILTLIDF